MFVNAWNPSASRELRLAACGRGAGCEEVFAFEETHSQVREISFLLFQLNQIPRTNHNDIDPGVKNLAGAVCVQPCLTPCSELSF